MLRLSLLAFIFFSWISLSPAADRWTFHFEAEKGDTVASISRKPDTIEAQIRNVLRHSPDPLDSGGDIQKTALRTLGKFRRGRLIEARVRIKDRYYTDLYLLLYEAAPARYLPVYAQQYFPDVRTPKLQSFSRSGRECSIRVTMQYSGTGAFRTTDKIILTGKNRISIRLRTHREK